jgi:hypothetical protein
VQGVTGAQGITGAQGVQGIQGAFGAQGTTGAQGIQGTTGTQGDIGTQGAIGAQGTTGAQGIQGTTGTQGAVGTQGAIGAQGIQGITGAQGATGTQGTQGSTGIQGTTGAQGITGAQGTTGTQGATGIQGIQGVLGAQGTTGAQGTQGVQGGVGIQGAQGIQGVLGAQGTQGIQGPGTVITSTVDNFTGNGSQVDFVLSTSPSNENFTWINIDGVEQLRTGYSLSGSTITFSSPPASGASIEVTSLGGGITGTQGTTGIQGNTGTQGTTGAGTQGTTGAQGIQGTTGIQGDIGTQGATGAGTQGTTGAQGIQGTTGIQGDIGTQGATGAQGIQGIQGITGTQGTQGIQGITGPSTTINATDIATGTMYPVMVGAAGVNQTANVDTPGLSFDASTNTLSPGNLTVAGTITVNSGAAATAIVNGAGNAVGNIGSSSTYFNQLFAQATTALYADLAEMYTADAQYEPGTVLELGGSQEVTASLNDSSSCVAGVVSTNPAHLMNGGLAGTYTVAVALVGRVPCKIIGPISKGNMIVSAGNGCGRAESSPAVGTVIGKAVENHPAGPGVIEILIGKM